MSQRVKAIHFSGMSSATDLYCLEQLFQKIYSTYLLRIAPLLRDRIDWINSHKGCKQIALPISLMFP